MVVRRVAAYLLLVSVLACAPAGQAARPAGPGTATSPARTTPSPGDPGPATPTRIATPARGAIPPPASGLLFAVLEATGQGAALNLGLGDRPDTVAIVGLDGAVRARATFAPRTAVFVGNAAPIQGPVARTAAGAVYFADGGGAVRRLSPDGTVRQEALFPTPNPQSQLRFAVSPDGGTILATTITAPARNPQPSIQAPFAPGGRWSVSLDRAGAGGSVRVYERDLGETRPRAVPTVAGWIAAGPLFGDAELGAQAPPVELLAAHDVGLAALDGTRAGEPLGGAGCAQQSWNAGGDVLCMGPPIGQSTESVRTATGRVRWNVPPECGGLKYMMWALSPRGLRVASEKNVCGRDGSVIAWPPGFYPEGWLDDNTLIGTARIGSRDMVLLRLSDPTAPQPLGFQGEFVGVVS